MTDKVNVQIPSPRSGLVSRVLAKEGDTVKVGQTILVISEDGEKKPEFAASSPIARETTGLPGEPRAGLSGSGTTTTTTTTTTARVLATPATRRLARELNVDISTLKGGGPQGRVTDEDVRSAAQRGAQGVTTRMIPVTTTSAVVTQPS